MTATRPFLYLHNLAPEKKVDPSLRARRGVSWAAARGLACEWPVQDGPDSKASTLTW